MSKGCEFQVIIEWWNYYKTGAKYPDFYTFVRQEFLQEHPGVKETNCCTHIGKHLLVLIIEHLW